MLHMREELRLALIPLVGEYIAMSLAQDVAGDGRTYAVAVVEREELYRADGVQGLIPPQGDVVDFVSDAGRWSLLVDRAMFGQAHVVLLGLQGGRVIPFADAKADTCEWRVYADPAWSELVRVSDALAIGADPPAQFDGGVRPSGDPWPMPAYGGAVAWTPPGHRLGRVRTWLAMKLAPWIGELETRS